MRIIQYAPRACDCCESVDLEEVWSYSAQARTRSDVSLWEVRNVVCRFCGFAFVSPAPVPESLAAHYNDSLPISEERQPDFSIVNRIGLIERHLPLSPQQSVYLEVGSSTCPQFLAEVAKRFASAQTVEIYQNEDSSSGVIEDVPRETVDVLAAYFVLEHVPNPLTVLTRCANALKDAGTLIIEVPDLYQYPETTDGLAMHEHVNHFSLRSLSRLAAMVGLRLIDFSRSLRSHPGSFAAAFAKTYSTAQREPDPTERVMAMTCMGEGVERLKHFGKMTDQRA